MDNIGGGGAIVSLLTIEIVMGHLSVSLFSKRDLAVTLLCIEEGVVISAYIT